MNKLFLVIFFAFLGCGKSPFLDDKKTEEVRGLSELKGQLSFASTKSSLQLFWRKGPLIGDESRLLIIHSDLYGKPTNLNKELSLMLWMPTMGHGSFPVKIKNTDIGIYEAADIFFTMPGLWDLHFQIKNGSQIEDEVIWSLDL